MNTERILRMGFDQRVVWALRMVGVNLGEHLWYSGRRANHTITFTYHGDTEMAKGVLTDFIRDEFNGTQIKFFAHANDKHQCYCTFNEGRTL